MSRLEVPAIEGFGHRGGYTSWLGQEYQVYRRTSGIEIILSAAGVQAFEEDLPGFADQIQEVAEAVAEGPEQLGEERRLPLDGSRWLHKDHSLAPSGRQEKPEMISRYHARGWPTTTVESYDFDSVVGRIRFDTMNMLAERLALDRSVPVNAPSQYALFRNHRTDHDAALMEQVEGVTLWNVNRRTEKSHAIEARHRLINHAINRAVPSAFKRHMLLDDINRGGDILVNDGHYIIVDQPNVAEGSHQRLFHRLMNMEESVRRRVLTF